MKLMWILGLGHWEIGIVLLVALLLFGKRLPDVARSLGRSIIEFKKGVKGIETDVEKASDAEPAATEKQEEK